MAYGSTQQNYAGPVNPGDMVVQNNTVSPGIAALLRKENRRGAQGIIQLPEASKPAPDFYNQALMNVQDQIQGQANTLNAMAPDGERLAYINEQEAGILKLLGGAGEPVNPTGIPSFYTTGGGQYGGYSRDRSGAKAAYDRSQADSAKKESRVSQDLIDAMSSREKSGSVYTDPAKEDAREFVPMVAGGIGAAEFADDENISNNFAQQALINAYITGSADQMGGKDYTIGDSALKGLNALKGQANNTIFSSDYNKMFNQGLEEAGLRKESVLGFDYTTDDGKRLKYALGGGSSGIGSFAKMIADNSMLTKLLDLLPGDSYDDMSFDQRLKAYDNMLAQKARQDFLSSKEGPKTTTSTTEESSEEEDGDEDEIDFFDYARRFRQPMDYQSILDRAFKGSTDGALLESYKEAMERATA
tara:strand:- start:10046 stop:11293 length:1248 start_codon:yes stop_codon:yes gene_type:complete